MIEKIVELLEKYRKENEGKFDHQTVRVNDKNVFIHFHDNEVELHIVDFNNSKK